MNEKIIGYFKDIIEVKIKGRNISRFLKMLYKNKITLFNVQVLNSKEVKIKLYNQDLDKIRKISKTYDIEILSCFGRLKYKSMLITYYPLIISILCGFLLFNFLTNLIFEVEIRHASKSIRQLIDSELKRYNIVKYSMKKSFKGLSIIKKKILTEYKDKIEWLEIEEIGNRYIVKVEERKIVNNNEREIKQHIVAGKSAIIVKINATSGMVLKTKNDYVNKGDVVISGQIKHGDAIVDTIKASGRIYGEVWYNIKVELPIKQTIYKPTGKRKKVLVLKVVNYKLNIFDFSPFKDKKIISQEFIKNRLIPVGLYIEDQSELNIIRNNYTFKEALVKAEEIALSNMKAKLNKKGEYVISKHRLSMVEEENKVKLEVFFKVCEDITDTLIIAE